MKINRRVVLFGGVAVSALKAASFGKEVLGANTAMLGYGIFQAIDAIRRLGFTAIEIHTMGVPQPVPNQFPGFEVDKVTAVEKRNIRKALHGFRRLTTHLPYLGLSPFSADRRMAEESIHTIRTALQTTAYVGAELAVLHVVPPKDRSPEEARPIIVNQIREWGAFAARNKFKLAVETGYPNSVQQFTSLIEDIGHEAVGCTVDVGHQKKFEELKAWVTPEEHASPAGIRAYNDVIHAIIDRLGAKILHCHVHDIDPSTWQEHLPIGTGFVDYPRLIAKLSRIQYRGLLMFEIGGPGSEIEARLADSKRKLEVFL